MTEPSTSSRILQAAAKQLESGGAQSISMRRIAADVGVTPMSVYRHYSDRADLLNQLVESGFQELGGKLTSTRGRTKPMRHVRMLIEIFLDFALERPHMFSLMFLEPREGARQYPSDFRNGESPTAHPFAMAIERTVQQGILCACDANEVTFQLGAMLQGLIMLFLGNRIDMSAAQFRRFSLLAAERYLSGLLARKDPEANRVNGRSKQGTLWTL